MARIVDHLLHKNADKGWHLEDKGESIARYDSKEEAIEAGKKKGNDLKGQGKDAQLLIHREDVSIETECTCGHDPRNTAG